MSPESCVYEGTIRHRRLDLGREFTHRLALAYIDLDELPWLLGGRFLVRRPGPLRFRRADYHGDPQVPLDQAVRATVSEQTGSRPRGPIRVLTQLRSWGHCFNPVSLYYCFGENGRRVDAVMAEVTNTPWGERHGYVLSGSTGAGVLNSGFQKALHVSPFMGMEHRYEARGSVPAQTLSFHVGSARDGVVVFDATLSLRRQEFTRRRAAELALRYPMAGARTLALIYARALALRLAGARVHAHPGLASLSGSQP